MSNTDLRALLAEVDVYLRELYVPAYMRKKRERLCARITAALAEKDDGGWCQAQHVQNTNGGTDYWCSKCQAIRLTKCCRDLPTQVFPLSDNCDGSHL